MTVFVYDTFTDTNSTSLLSHTGETGATWTYIFGAVPGTHPTINNNKLQHTPGSIFNVYAASGTPPSADYSVEADIVYVNTNNYGSIEAGVCARLYSGTNTGYAFGFGGGTWYISRCTSGGGLHPASVPAGTYTAGDPVTLRIAVSGTGATVNVKGYVNDVLTLEWNDTDVARITNAGNAGVKMSGANYVTWDFDTLTASDLSAEPLSSVKTYPPFFTFMRR